MPRSVMGRLASMAPALVLGCWLSGCAHAPHPVELRRPASASGVWDHVSAARDGNGDQRIEQAEWHLVQRGGVVAGFYLHRVTVVSADGNPYRCNHGTRYERRARVDVVGSVAGEEAELREVRFSAEPGPCESGRRTLLSWRATLGERTAALWSIDVPSAAPAMLFKRPVERTRVLARHLPGGPLSGRWDWEIKSVDIHGDELIEREEWHLDQRGDEVSGYYDRQVQKISGDGLPFRCSRATEYVHRTRYRLDGVVRSGKVELREVDFKADPSECATPRGSLDAYRGTWNGDELVLSWGSGLQVLRRAPNKAARR